MSVWFLDTAYVLALEFAGDQNHEAAIRCSRQFQLNGDKAVTTSFILDEVVTYLNVRGHHSQAVRLGGQLMNSVDVTFVEVDHELLIDGWNYLVQHQDKQYSLTDCISFVLMQQRGLRRVLTFDRHFIQAGFDVLPTSAK